jgi:hypothetical protein
MPDAYIIEIGGHTAGIVARNGRDQSFGFFASSPAFGPMEGHSFSDPVAAECAARRLAKCGRQTPKGAGSSSDAKKK